MDLELKLQENLPVKDSLSTTKEYYKKHPRLIAINIFIMITTSLLGLVITGILGAIAGFVIGILSFLYLPPAIIKIKEIRHH